MAIRPSGAHAPGTVQLLDSDQLPIRYQFNPGRTVQIPAGEQLKLPFRDENVIGHGSFGTVYRGKGILWRSESLEHLDLAIKIIPDIENDDWDVIRREIEVLQHRYLGSVVRLYGSFTFYDAGTSSGPSLSKPSLSLQTKSPSSPAFPSVPVPAKSLYHSVKYSCRRRTEGRFPDAQEMVEGKMLCLLHELAPSDLWTLLRMPDTHGITAALRICGGLVWTMSRFHRNRDGFALIHYDLKPNNILVFPDKPVPHHVWKIADFGMAQLHTVGEDSGVDPASLGTYEYYPPEYYNENGDEASRKHGREFDVWALGCILLEVALWAYTGSGDAVHQFREERANMAPEQRQRKGKSEQKDPSFFNSQEVVDKKRKGLMDNQNNAFNALLALISQMLERDPDMRITMDDAFIYWKKHVREALPVPAPLTTLEALFW